MTQDTNTQQPAPSAAVTFDAHGFRAARAPADSVLEVAA